MKKCPFCAEDIQTDAIKCRYCGEFLNEAPAPRVQIEPSLEEQRKWAEIHRLQRIASGAPTRADNLRKTKGLLALVIIIAILLYAYTWNQKYSKPTQTVKVQSALSFEELNALFGPASPLPPDLQENLFAKHRGQTVVWNGTLTYINPGKGSDLFITVQHNLPMPSAGVQVRFPETSRDQLAMLRTGQHITYQGKLIDYDPAAQFFSLRDGAVLTVE